MFLVYGDIINSRRLTAKQIAFFWKSVSKQNEKKFVVPFYVLLGDSFHGVVASKKEAKEWIENFSKVLKKQTICCRYAVVEVVGNFSQINTVKKYEKKAQQSEFLRINPLNIPELILCDEKVNAIKGEKKERVLWLRKPSLEKRQTYHKVMTLEYLPS